MEESSQNSIKLNAFGAENLEYINSTDMDNIIDNVKSYDEACSTPSKLVRLIHFHEDHPENHNLKLKDGSAYIYNGEKWESKNKEKSINILVDKAFNMIVSYYNRRKILYREKNKIIKKQKDLYDQYPELKDEIYEKLKVIEDTPIIIDPILSPNMDEEVKLEDSIFGLYGNDFLQEYFDARKKEMELESNQADEKELQEVREKIKELDAEEEKIRYSSSEDHSSDDEVKVNLCAVEEEILNLENKEKKQRKKKNKRAAK